MGYKKPSKELESVVDCEASPPLLVDPTGKWAVVLRYKDLGLTIEDVSKTLVRTAGLCFDPVLRIPKRSIFAYTFTIKRIFDGEQPAQEDEATVNGLEGYSGFRYFHWHPEAKRLIFAGRRTTDNGTDRLDLMMISLNPDLSTGEQSFQAVPLINDRVLNAVVNRPFVFLGDGSHIICHVSPDDGAPPPAAPSIPVGPNIKENLSSKKIPARTYQWLISSAHDEELFEYYTSSDILLLFVDENSGAVHRDVILRREMVRSISLSPDGMHILASITKRPFSWTLPYGKFAKTVEVWRFNRPLSKYPPPSLHSKATTKHPAYPERGLVKVTSFDEEDPEYSPVEFTHKVVFDNDSSKKIGGWADPPLSEMTSTELESRFSYHGPLFLYNRAPRNPVGRTGMTGRGLLGKWGPNHAADAIVTRYEGDKLQMVAICRKDTGVWAIPGGMVDPGESVPMAMKREFLEEAANLNLDEEGRREHAEKIDKLFSKGFEIYRGYVDDPRNTDNAWMESSFVHFHCDKDLAQTLKLEAGDDAGAVTWLDVDESNESFRNLYASHKEMVLRAAKRLQVPDAYFGTPPAVVDRMTVLDMPNAEGVPISFDARRKGPRDFGWHWQKPRTLKFSYSLDQGDPKNPPDEDGKRDAVFLLSAPYVLDSGIDRHPLECKQVSLLAKLQFRADSIRWSPGYEGLGFLKEYWHKTRWTRTWVIKESSPESNTFTMSLLFDRSSDDAYASPGSFVTTRTRDGRFFVLQNETDGAFHLLGNGASPIGSRPFYDQLYLEFDSSNNIQPRLVRKWRSTFAPDADTTLIDLSGEVEGKLREPSRRSAILETPDDVLPGGEWLLVTKESNDEPPNHYWHHIPSGNEWQLTSFPHPQPALVGIQRSLVQYKRHDGVELNGELFLPSGYDPVRDGPRPCLLWSYPREFKAKATAGQVKSSPHSFTSTSWSRPTLWVVKGWVVLGFSSPIVGEGEHVEPNDSFVEQVQLNARAAVELLINRGVGKLGGFAVGGHSYGAFMTSHLLAHTNFFNAGIARSGAYLRVLTPFGFQSEERSFWDAPDTYMELSPFSHVPNIVKNGGKLLMIHGIEDENSGTYPLQSERLYDALKGHGAIARLVLLPGEGHGYMARESILHVIAEQEDWLEKHVTSSFNEQCDRKLDPIGLGKEDGGTSSEKPIELALFSQRAEKIMALTVVVLAVNAIVRFARL